MTQPIYSHTYANGLVLVAEPMLSLESVAFTFLVPSSFSMVILAVLMAVAR